MKLQDSYASESGMLGTWKLIGYIAPGTNGKTTSFEYLGGTTEATTTCASGTYNKDKGGCFDEEQATAATGSSLTKGWIAKNVVKLNDCAPAENWDISATIGTAAANTGAVAYSKTELSAECQQLTPNFALIGK